MVLTNMIYTKVYHVSWEPKVLNMLSPKPDTLEVQNAIKNFNNLPNLQQNGRQKPFGEYPMSYPLEKGEALAGIDIPCLVRSLNGSAEKKIMIIGEAPRRNRRSKNCIGHCTLGTPYAIRDYGFPKSCNVYKDIIDNLLEDHIIYLTDAIKVWSDVRQIKLKPSPGERIILKKEIDKEKPDKIVTFGKVARETVQGILGNNSQYDLCHLYHPSPRCRNHWKRKTQTSNVSQAACNYIRSNSIVDMFK